MTKIYRKTATIKAEQFDPENGIVPQVVFDKEYEHTTSGMISAMVDELNTGKPSHNWHVKTLEGYLKINPGDWIATGVNGEHWPIADDIFKKTYTELPVIPEDVASVIKQAKNRGYRLGWVFHNAYLGIWRVSVSDWIKAHADMFARAWLDGFQTED